MDFIDCPCPHCGAMVSIVTYASDNPYMNHLPADAVPTVNAAEVLFEDQRWDTETQTDFGVGQVRCDRCHEVVQIVSDPPLPSHVALRLVRSEEA